MAAVLGATAEKFTQRFVREAVDPRDGSQRLAVKETEAHGGRCALLVGRNTCSVYDARPEHCRIFPYWDSVMTDAAAFESARSTCPGIAVEVGAEVKERAFAALEQLHASLEPTIEPATCCLDGSGAEVEGRGGKPSQAPVAGNTGNRSQARPAPADEAMGDIATSNVRTTAGEVTFATALEADYALAERPKRAGNCRLGDRRPMACRYRSVASGADADDNVGVNGGERSLRDVRDIERACGYPPAYAALADLLRARGANVGDVT